MQLQISYLKIVNKVLTMQAIYQNVRRICIFATMSINILHFCNIW